MATENEIALTQEEIDRVLNTVRQDNKEQEELTPLQEGISLCQADLDALFGKNSNSTTISIHSEKIAARREQSAALLAKVNASSPKRISVVYGTVLCPGEKVDELKVGGLLELDRLSVESAEIYVDGKLFGRGKLGTVNDHAAVKLTQILNK